MFHQHFGYYAQGVGPTTAILPAGWKDRLVAITGPTTSGATGWCLDVHDLVLAKYVPFREKDEAFIREVIALRWVRRERLQRMLATMPIDEAMRSRIAEQIQRHFAEPRLR